MWSFRSFSDFPQTLKSIKWVEGPIIRLIGKRLYFLNPSPQVPQIKEQDLLICVCLFLFSFLSRFVKPHQPEHQIFDEYYFGWYITSYVNRWFHWDIHPPLTRMLMALLSYLQGYDGSIEFRKGPRFQDAQYVTLRMITQFFASLCAPMAYIAGRMHNFSSVISFFISLFVVCDSSLIGESRFISTDPGLHFWTLLTVAVLPSTSFYRVYSGHWWISMLLSSLSFSCALCTKWTSGGLFALIIVWHFGDIARRRFDAFWEERDIEVNKEVIVRGIFVFVFPACFIVFMCSVHMSVFLWDAEMAGSLSNETRLMLLNETDEPDWSQRINSTGAVERGMELIGLMMSYTTVIGNASKPHASPIESSMWEWPLMRNRWLCVSRQSTGAHVFGSPFIWYSMFIVVVIASLFCFVQFLRGSLTPLLFRCITFLAGYWASYLPFMFVTRSLYVYHYCIPGMLSVFAGAAFFEAVLPGKWSGFVMLVLTFLAIFGYFYWMPFSYDIHIENPRRRIWNPKWTSVF